VEIKESEVEEENWMLDNELQSENALIPIEVIEFGIKIEANLRQLKNVLSSIEETELGIDTDNKEVQ